MERKGPLLSSNFYNDLGLLLIERHVIKLLCKLHQSRVPRFLPRFLLSPYAEVKEFIVRSIVGAVGGGTTGLVLGLLTG